MSEQHFPLDLLFLGSGNAFAAEGRAFSSFVLNGRYLFDCGPTILQQLRKAKLPSNEIEAVFISHFHADHFFGLPFLFLDARFSGRSSELLIVGPPGIEERTERLLDIGYPVVLENPSYTRRYQEVTDGSCGEVNGLRYRAAQVKHVPGLQCFAYRAELDGRSIIYSGDTTLCGSLLTLVSGADVVVVECSCKEEEVHLSPEGVEEVARHARGASVIVTHLDGHDHPHNFEGLVVAEDLGRYRL